MKGQKEVQKIEAERFDDLVKHGWVKPGGLGIDGGAHIGSWAVKMSKNFDVVHAFEPCITSYKRLLENVTHHLCTNVVTHQHALMDKCCTVRVVAPRPKRQTLTARQVEYVDIPTFQPDEEITEAVSIDSLDLDRCDFIKLDLEGNELTALRGAVLTIDKFRPFLVIEFNDKVGKYGQTLEILQDFIARLGYVRVWKSGVDKGFACKQR